MNKLQKASREVDREVLEHYLPDDVHGVRAVHLAGADQPSVITALGGREVEPSAFADAVNELHHPEVSLPGGHHQPVIDRGVITVVPTGGILPAGVYPDEDGIGACLLPRHLLPLDLVLEPDVAVLQEPPPHWLEDVLPQAGGTVLGREPQHQLELVQVRTELSKPLPGDEHVADCLRVPSLSLEGGPLQEEGTSDALAVVGQYGEDVTVDGKAYEGRVPDVLHRRDEHSPDTVHIAQLVADVAEPELEVP